LQHCSGSVRFSPVINNHFFIHHTLRTVQSNQLEPCGQCRGAETHCFGSGFGQKFRLLTTPAPQH
jgi:hypothetical protein